MGVYYAHYLIPRDNTHRPTPDRVVALIEAWRTQGYIVDSGPAPRFNVDAREREQREVFDREFALRSMQDQAKRKAGLAGWLSTALGRKHRPVPPVPWKDTSELFLIPPLGESLTVLSAPGAIIRWRLDDYLSLGTRYPLDMLPDPSLGRPDYSLDLNLFDDFIYIPSDTYFPCKELSTLCICGNELNYKARGIRGFDDRIRRACPSCGTPFRPQDQVVEIAIGATGGKYEEQGGVCYRFAIVVTCGKSMPFSEPPRDPKADSAFMETCRSALGIEMYDASQYF